MARMVLEECERVDDRPLPGPSTLVRCIRLEVQPNWREPFCSAPHIHLPLRSWTLRTCGGYVVIYRDPCLLLDWSSRCRLHRGHPIWFKRDLRVPDTVVNSSPPLEGALANPSRLVEAISSVPTNPAADHTGATTRLTVETKGSCHHSGGEHYRCAMRVVGSLENHQPGGTRHRYPIRWHGPMVRGRIQGEAPIRSNRFHLRGLFQFHREAVPCAEGQGILFCTGHPVDLHSCDGCI